MGQGLAAVAEAGEEEEEEEKGGGSRALRTGRDRRVDVWALALSSALEIMGQALLYKSHRRSSELAAHARKCLSAPSRAPSDYTAERQPLGPRT